MPSKGDFYKIIFSPMGKSIGETVQLIECAEQVDCSFMWMVRASKPLDTIGGTKETLIWVPLDWMEPMGTVGMQ